MISRAIENAYNKAKERNWDKIYYLVDLHETVFYNNYDDTATKAYPCAIRVLKELTKFPETRIILWSSVNHVDKLKYLKTFQDLEIPIMAFNENKEVENTKVGNFEEKPYFSVIIDDKAGFSPSHGDWDLVLNQVKINRADLNLVQQ